MVDILELIGKPTRPKYCINVRGTNGCGKTTLAREFMKLGYEEVTTATLKNSKPGFVLCPEYELLLIGNYRNKCGGCDILVKEQIVRLLKLAWMTPYNIIFEGVLVSNSCWPYLELMREYSKEIYPRLYGFAYLDLPLEECLRRIYQRNGGKQINEELVARKHNDAIRYRGMHQTQDDCLVMVLDALQSPFNMMTDLLAEIKLAINE